MANVLKTSFAVSVTPKVQMDAQAGINQAMDVINEDVRASLGGSGSVTSDDLIINDLNNNGSVASGEGEWVNGVHNAVASSASGGLIAFDTNTDMVFIKHTGLLAGTSTASAVADTVKIAIDGSETSGVSGDGVIIAELANGEAMVIPRPGIAGGYLLITGNSTNHVDVEVYVAGT